MAKIVTEPAKMTDPHRSIAFRIHRWWTWRMIDFEMYVILKSLARARKAANKAS